MWPKSYSNTKWNWSELLSGSGRAIIGHFLTKLQPKNLKIRKLLKNRKGSFNVVSTLRSLNICGSYLMNFNLGDFLILYLGWSCYSRPTPLSDLFEWFKWFLILLTPSGHPFVKINRILIRLKGRHSHKKTMLDQKWDFRNILFSFITTDYFHANLNQT